MYSPPLQFHSVPSTQYVVQGDVTIDPGAAIAPGVVLQADPGNRIVIAMGVCIGIGTVIHACQGSVWIDTGANLGAGVLVVGEVKIGAQACIGSASTLFNRSVQPNTLVAPSSLLVDPSIPSRTTQSCPENLVEQVIIEEVIQETVEKTVEKMVEKTVVNVMNPVSPTAPVSPATANSPNAQPGVAETDEIDAPVSVSTPVNGKTSPYGQAYVNQLLGKLFPHQAVPHGSDSGSQGTDPPNPTVSSP